MGDDQSWLIDLFFVIYGVFILLGIGLCFVFLVALIRGRKLLNKWPFYRIVWSLAVMNTIFMLVQSVFNSPIFETAVDIVNTIPQKGVLYLTLLMSLNRFAAFVVPSLKTLFSKTKIRLTIVLTWIWIIFLSIVAQVIQPTQEWNNELLKYENTGPGLIDAPAINMISHIIDNIIPFLIVSIYIFIYYVIKRERRFINSGSITDETRHRGSDDNRLLYQGIIIASFLQLELFLNILDMTTSVINQSVHSFLFLVTNPTIRGFLPKISSHCFWKLSDLRWESGSTAREQWDYAFGSASEMYTGIGSIGALVLLISRMKSSDENFSLDVALLTALIISGIVAGIGFLTNRTALIIPFLVSAALFSLFFAVFWITQVIVNSPNAVTETIALCSILYVVGHGFHVIVASICEIRVKRREEKFDKF